MRAVRKIARILALSLGLSSCALYSEVEISPLFVLPSDLRRNTNNVTELVAQGDFLRVLEQRKVIEGRREISAKELAALGAAEVAAGRFVDAKTHLRAALDLKPFRNDIGAIAWDLSQLEYLSNNFAESHEWAQIATTYGTGVRRWHLDYLEALSSIKAYQVEGRATTTVPMIIGDPDIPRLKVSLNGVPNTAIIDSGAALTIMSQKLAEQLALQSLGDFRGTFFGLLGEPISVWFSVLQELRIGEIVIRNVPIAVMPNEKLNFVVVKNERIEMDLLLGATLLKEFQIMFDYRASELTLSIVTPGRVPAINQNLFFVGFRPFVHATINGKGWYPFVLDTGSEITFLNESELAGTSVHAMPKLHGAMLQGLGGARKYGAKVEDIEIGVDKWAGDFKNLPLYSTEKSQALGIIGQDFLKNFRVVIDFGTMRVDLYRAGQPQPK